MISEYLNYLTNVMGYSRNTCEAYRNDLVSFAHWAKEHLQDARWSTLRREDLEAYITCCSNMGYLATSTNRKLSALRSFYRYLIRQGRLQNNPAKGVYHKAEPIHVPSTISRNTIIEIYNKSEGVTKVMVALLYTTGVRLSELLSLRWDDVNLQECSIKIMGKGCRERLVFIPKGVANLLSDLKEQDTHDSAVIPYGARSCRRLLHDAFASIGSHEPCNPHAFRHTAATEWATNGASNTMIAKALGHTRLETSKKYIDIAQNGIKTMMATNNMLN